MGLFVYSNKLTCTVVKTFNKGRTSSESMLNKIIIFIIVSRIVFEYMSTITGNNTVSVMNVNVIITYFQYCLCDGVQYCTVCVRGCMYARFQLL